MKGFNCKCPLEYPEGVRREVFVLGDVHAGWKNLNLFLENEIFSDARIGRLARKGNLEVIVIQCGDMGYFWPGYRNEGSIMNRDTRLVDGRAKIIWCPGNHENFDALDALQKKKRHRFFEVDRGVYFASFGALMRLFPGRTALFCGKGKSHDRHLRTPHISWWAQEEICAKDMKRLPEERADIVISHTAPSSFALPLKSVWPEESRQFLEIVYQRYRPLKWFFGHFHFAGRGRKDECEWTALSPVGKPGAWTGLKEF